MIDVNPDHRLAKTRPVVLCARNATAHGIVKNEDPIGARRLLQGVLDFRIVDGLHLIIAIKVCHGRCPAALS